MLDLRRLGLISLDFASPQECLEATRSRGFGWMEAYIDGVANDDVHSLVRWSIKRGVTVSTLSTLSKLGSSEDDADRHIAAVERSILLAAETGVARAGFMYGGSSTLGEVAARRRFAERIEPLLGMAESLGVRLVIENVFSRGTGVDLESVAAIEELFAVLPPRAIGLTFDPANLAIAGEEAYPYALARLREHCAVIHLKDVTRHVPETHGTEADCRPLVESRRGRFITVPLGEGSLNMLALAGELLASDDDTPLLLEPFRSGASREAWIDRSLANLSRPALVDSGARNG
ncbi:sugar phosphate isomerase/epimerase family protein [Cryobacterium tagatosivorans]|nr:sugar phosphate isomerase/epimerase family protein [Cryobacterium tagatosivorans]